MRKLLVVLTILLGLTGPTVAQRVQTPSNTAIVCAYNSSPPTLTSGWFGYAQCDSAGKLITTTSGGGGGGAVTIADGADVTQGALADAASSAGGAGSLSAKLRLMTTQLGTINTTLGSPFQAAGSIGNTSFGATQAVAANLNATVVGTGTFVTQATLAAETTKVIGTVNQGTSPWVISGALSANQSVNVAQINGVTPLMGNGTTGTGSPRVTIASDGTAISTTGYMSVKLDQTTNGTTNGVAPLPATSGGLSTYFVQPTASDNHVVIKAGAGQVYYVLAMNNSATVNYLRLYDATTGFNGCNSATNLITQIQVPASTSVGGVSIPLAFGLPFATGISICVTSGYATNDTTNATATAMSITVGYK